MSNPGRLIAKLRAYGDGDLDFRCTDHQHVDAGVGQSFKESGGDAGMGTHANPYHRNLDNVRASPKLPAGSIRKVFLERLFGPKSILGRHGKSQVRLSVAGNVLNDHVHHDFRLGHDLENCCRRTRSIG